MIHTQTMKTTTLPWSTLKTILLDMDGTLLDLHFDDTFFREIVPQRYAQKQGVTLQEAHQTIWKAYKKVEGTLDWYDLNYWSHTLDLNMSGIKKEMANLIDLHPTTLPFLEKLKKHSKNIHLVTNAHGDSLTLKLKKTPIGSYMDSIITSHDLGYAKEDPNFWPLLHNKLHFDPIHTLLVDDSEPVLQAASTFGIGHLIHISAPSSNLTPTPSTYFPSIINLGELTNSLE